MAVPKIQRPTLYRPGLLAPDDPQLKAIEEKEAAKAAAEAPWRATLEEMSREQLIDLAIAGAWRVEYMSAHIERLREKYLAHRRGRQSGGKNSHIDQQKAKALIKDAWLVESTAATGRFNASAFSRRMQTKYPVITAPRTIEGWIRGWKKPSPAVKPSNSSLGLPQCPEIFQLLGYFDPAKNVD